MLLKRIRRPPGRITFSRAACVFAPSGLCVCAVLDISRRAYYN